MTKLKFLRLEATPLLYQLQIEEALLRSSKENWFIQNTNAPDAIILGCGCKKEEHLDNPPPFLPIIQRFSGGGSVYVDSNTVLCSFIFQKKDEPFCFPEMILRHTELFYKNALKIDGFKLQENDFVIGKRKCGGNALCIIKDSWLQHTSFIWDCSYEKWRALKQPKQQPAYRNQRSHADFMQPLKECFESKITLTDAIYRELQAQFIIEQVFTDSIQSHLQAPHRKTVSLL